MLLMWKPVQLQGVGSASSIINANTHPAGKLDSWRRNVVCLFGLALNGTPTSPPILLIRPVQPAAQDGLELFHRQHQLSAGDRLPLEATVGWDATLNGNLAELLQEQA